MGFFRHDDGPGFFLRELRKSIFQFEDCQFTSKHFRKSAVLRLIVKWVCSTGKVSTIGLPAQWHSLKFFNHDSGGRTLLWAGAHRSFTPLLISHDSGGRNIFGVTLFAFSSRNGLGSEVRRVS